MKRTVLTVVQLAITAGILWFVFRDPHKRGEMASALAHANPLWLLTGFACYGAVELCATVRWQLLLRVQGVHLSWTRTFALVMIGLFFNFFIPGGTGGDAVKIFYLLKETPGHRAGAVLSVLVDRLVGLCALIVLAGVLIVLKWQWLMSDPETAHWVELVLLVLGGSLLFLVTSFVITGFHLVHQLPRRFPGRDRLAELALAYRHYGRRWRTTLAAFALSFLAHAGYWATFYCAALSFARPASKLPTLAEFVAIMPIVGTITSLPVSLGGIGWREVLFQTFLSNLCDASEGVAVAISSSGYFLTLGWGLIGGLMYLAYRPSVHPKLRQMRAEVAAFEHKVAAREIAMESRQDEP